jgi:hypothetical protein
MTFLAAAMLALLARVYAHESATAATALGPVIGLAATLPHLIPLAGFVALSGLFLALRRPRLPARTIMTALLLALAVVLPTLPDAATLQAMMTAYVVRNSEWQGLEAVLLGQRSILDVPQLHEGGKGGPWDVGLGAVLAPVAIARTPLRLWGDSLLDAVGAALVAAGTAMCLSRLTRDRRALFALVLMAVSISPGLLSGYDRTSLHRMVAGPVIWSMLGAIGYAVMCRRSAARNAAASLAVAIGLSGTLLFDWINPRFVPASWMTVALEANEDLAASAKVAFLDHGWPSRQEWLHVETIARYLGKRRIDSVAFAGPNDLDAITTGISVIYWSPALEGAHQVGEAVCAKWPNARMYRLNDAAGISGALAAVIDGSARTPALPKERWLARPCVGRV